MDDDSSVISDADLTLDTLEVLRESFAQRTPAERIATRLDTLSSVSAVIRSRILSSLSEDDVERLCSPGRTLINLVCRHGDEDPAELALRVSLDVLCFERETEPRSFTFLYASERALKVRRASISLRALSAAFLDHEIVAVVSDSTDAFVHRDLTDIVVDVSMPDRAFVEAVLTHRFDADATLPDDFVFPAELSLAALDLVCAKGRTLDEAVSMIGTIASAATPPAPEPAHIPDLDELQGYGAAKPWALDLIRDVQAYRAGHINWGDVDAGALLVGPPGTGKTTFAAAIAAAGAMRFFPTSYADWQRAGDGHLGNLLREMSQVFKQAASSAPALLFIDEIDTLPARGTGRYADWWRSIVNGLLEQIDGSEARTGVVVLAACNDATSLDPALVRAGRLDRTLRIELPDGPALAHILSVKLGGAIAADDLSSIGAVLAGRTSGADATRIARDARRIARRENRSVTAADVERIARPRDILTSPELRRIALHEAGHAVVALASGITPLSIGIIPNGGNGGGVAFEGSDNPIFLPSDVETSVVRLLAGRAAEEVILGNVSAGAGGSTHSDLATATSLLTTAESLFGLGSTLAYGGSVDRRIVETRLQGAYSQALLLVARHRTAVEALADLLIKDRAFGRDRLLAFAAEFDLGPATTAKPRPVPIADLSATVSRSIMGEAVPSVEQSA